jgi:cell division protein FtsW
MNTARMQVARLGQVDGVLFSCVILLCLFGLLMVYSSSAILARVAGQSDTVYLRSQIGKMVAGLGLMILFLRVPHRLLGGRVAWYGLAGAAVLLILLLLPLGLAVVVRGTRRFLNLGIIQVQPAEFARLALVVLLASYASRKQEWFRESWRSLVVPLAVIGLLCGLVLLQPNLSSAMLLGMLGVVLLWMGGQPFRRLLVVALPAVAVVAVTLKGYQVQRLVHFFRALLDGKSAELPYHLKQSLIAMGSGGFLGKGIGQGLQKYQYLPFPHTDSILGVVGEETGFLGVLVLFTVYGIVIHRGLRIARLAPDLFSGLLALGLTLSMAMNVLLHAAVVLGVGPATGVPLPFVSHGGSSLLTNLTAMGILLSISRHVRPEPELLPRRWGLPGGLLRAQ